MKSSNQSSKPSGSNLTPGERAQGQKHPYAAENESYRDDATKTPGNTPNLQAHTTTNKSASPTGPKIAPRAGIREDHNAVDGVRSSPSGKH
jgi:hypothetical protein